jgi:hypothetical protein
MKAGGGFFNETTGGIDIHYRWEKKVSTDYHNGEKDRCVIPSKGCLTVGLGEDQYNKYMKEVFDISNAKSSKWPNSYVKKGCAVVDRTLYIDGLKKIYKDEGAVNAILKTD